MTLPQTPQPQSDIDPTETREWLDALDADPRRWAFRLKVAAPIVEQMAVYNKNA